MYKNKKIIVIIPARGGSKGVPRKNVKPLINKPLIAYSIITARASCLVDKVLVTSEDDEILSVSKNYGADVYKRPNYLSDDKTALDEVIVDAVNNLQTPYDIVITIQPTSPLIKTSTLNKGIQAIIDQHKDSIMSLCDQTHLYWKEQGQKIIPDFTKRVNRQYLKKTYAETGAIIGATFDYIQKNNTRINTKSICFIITDPEESVDIDSYTDWQMVNLILKNKKIGIHVIGNKQSGLGHIYRQLTVAMYLDTKPTFFIHRDQDIALEKIKKSHYPYFIFSTEKELLSKIKKEKISTFINDSLDSSKKMIQSIKSLGIKIITFEDLGKGATIADVSINALYEISNSPANSYFGYNYVCLRPDVIFSPKKKTSKVLKNIIITCGGVDENNLTKKYLLALKDIDFKGQIRVIFGKGYTAGKKLEKEFKNSELNLTYYQNIANMADFIYWSDLALTSNGRTVYEITAIGVPCIAICQNTQETHHAFSNFCGCISNLGLAQMVSNASIVKEIKKYQSYTKRKKINSEMLELEIEKGTKKVINLINN